MSRNQRALNEPPSARLTHDEVIQLLGDLCIRLGFCLPPDEQQSLANTPPANIDQFTQAVFVAEGLGPVTSGDLYSAVRRHVTQAFFKHELETLQAEDPNYLADLEEIQNSRQAKAERLNF
jgi:hypothetical protein